MRSKKSPPYLEFRNVASLRETKRIFKETSKRANFDEDANIKLSC
jgi:hypothetical protein